MSHMLKLSDRKFKITILNVLMTLVQKLGKMHKWKISAERQKLLEIIKWKC